MAGNVAAKSSAGLRATRHDQKPICDPLRSQLIFGKRAVEDVATQFAPGMAAKATTNTAATGPVSELF